MGNGTVHDLIGRNNEVYCYVKNQDNNWFTIDFKDIRIKPTQYTMMHDWFNSDYALRSWLFQGSNDNENWITLKRHENDHSLNRGGATKTWNIDNCNEYYRYFKIQMTGKNHNDNCWHLMCHAFELYGTLESKLQDTSLPASFSPSFVSIIKIVKIV